MDSLRKRLFIKMDDQDKSALLFGATGLVGSNLLHILLKSPRYSCVTIITRKNVQVSHPKLNQIIVADFSALGDEKISCVYKVDDVFCCLGTTIKKAGSRERFWQVDYKYPLIAARQAQQCGAAQFLVVSAIGADPKSMFFYNRVKGELETALAQINFPSLHIFQPSLLLGKRQEYRLGETVGAYASKLVSPFLVGGLKKYQPIAASAVAYAMHQAACSETPGVNIHNSAQIAEVSRQCKEGFA